MRLGSGLACAVVLLALPAPALAAAPGNDNRVDARGLELPASVGGTTKEATLEDIEPPSCGFDSKGSVWYALHASSDRRIVVRLRAGGDLDAVVDVYRRVRSRLSGVACELTGEDGEAAFRFQGRAGADYVIRVAQQATSVPGDFRLDFFSPTAPARLPGPRLPGRGATRALDRLQNSDDAWSRRLRVGVTYRVNLATRARGCMKLTIFRRGSRVRSRGCGGYLLFTPGPREGGRYGFLVEANDRVRGSQRYHLQVAPAAGDDTAPGRRMSGSARGRLNGARVDVVDLYRFDILRRADVSLRLRSGADFSASIVGLGGRGYGASARLKPGRYFAVVRANGSARGRYRLRRSVRTITSTSITFNGARKATASPGSATIGVSVSPGASGPVTIVVERLDPLAGWQFSRRYRTRAVGGSANVSYLPRGEGHYRARASFRGTRAAAPSESGVARLRVIEPLRG